MKEEGGAGGGCKQQDRSITVTAGWQDRIRLVLPPNPVKAPALPAAWLDSGPQNCDGVSWAARDCPPLSMAPPAGGLETEPETARPSPCPGSRGRSTAPASCALRGQGWGARGRGEAASPILRGAGPMGGAGRTSTCTPDLTLTRQAQAPRWARQAAPAWMHRGSISCVRGWGWGKTTSHCQQL